MTRFLSPKSIIIMNFFCILPTGVTRLGSSRIVIIFTSVRWEGGGQGLPYTFLNVVYGALQFRGVSETFSKYSFIRDGGVAQNNTLSSSCRVCNGSQPPHISILHFRNVVCARSLSEMCAAHHDNLCMRLIILTILDEP